MEQALLTSRSNIFDGVDPRDVSCYVNEFVGRHSLRTAGTRSSQARLRYQQLSSVGLCHISYGSEVSITTTALGESYQLQLPLKGTSDWTGRNGTHHFTPGEFLLINPWDPAEVRYSSDCEKLIVKLPVGLVESMRADDDRRWPKSGICFQRAEHELSAVDGLLQLLALMCTEAETTTCDPSTRQQYSRILVKKLLAQLETNVVGEEKAPSNKAFQKIENHIRDNLEQDIALEELAALAYVSLRSLYVLFDKFAGQSPRDYIQQARLDRVHADLQRSGMRLGNVTEIASRYGFVHLGRFSALYKSRFGELPSQTLGRRR